jgi:KDO2-lipid IV(A) lauroyltransferase
MTAGTQSRPEAGALSAAGRGGGLLLRVLRFVVLYLLLRPLVLLPLAVQLRICGALGRLAARVAVQPRRVALRNLEACFPELRAEAIDELVRRQFESLGMSAVEMTFAWWASERRLRGHVRVEGLEHYDAARAAGRSVVFLTAHFTTMELCGISLALHVPGVHAVYRAFDRNPLADAIAREGRGRVAGGLIERDNVKAMVRALREKKPLWFASDQLVRPDKRSTLVPFFGVPCLVHGALLDLVRMTDACVLPVVPVRHDRARYTVTIEPALHAFPSGERTADMARIMKHFEERIRRHPEQYMWVWKRFAKRPGGYPDIYARDAAPGRDRA